MRGEGGRERETHREKTEKEIIDLVCSTDLYIHWLLLLCTSTGDGRATFVTKGMKLLPTELPFQGLVNF